MKIPKYTIGMGDRFAHQGSAQLAAVLQARQEGIPVYPVWNKSNREHTIIGTKPDDLRAEADAAVAAAGWKEPYFVDADHIGLKTVEWFLPASDFYTIDVADFSGRPADADSVEAFVNAMSKYEENLAIPGIEEPFFLDRETILSAAGKFLFAMQEAGKIYRIIAERKGAGNFVTEVSVDETDAAQTPVEMFLILAMIAREGIPAQTIAPKFTGRFNKGVDYVGDLEQFGKEFDQDLSVVAFAVREFGLPENLKLSVHSGSDKFSLYPIINRLIKKHDAGLHVKTAGTTWLEEVIGLAEVGGDGLRIAQEIYAEAYPKSAELIGPYAPVVDIDVTKLPTPDVVTRWSSDQFVSALRHDPGNQVYDVQFRQFIHVSFKIAAQMKGRYTDALKTHADVIGRNVTHNLFERHIQSLFS